MRMKMSQRTPMPSFVRLTLATALASVCTAHCANAQSPATNTTTPVASSTESVETSADTASTTLESVAVHVRDPRGEDSATRFVVIGEDLRQYGDLSLLDALKRVPGVTISAATPGRGGTIALRGMGGYTQILINGQKAATGFDLDSLTPEMIERVEILRTVTADLSSEGIAGTLNLVLKRSARSDASHLTAGWAWSDGYHSPSLSWRRSRHDDYRSHSLTATLSRRQFQYEDSGVETGHDASGTPWLRRDTDLQIVGRREGLNLAPTLELKLESGVQLSLQAQLDVAHLQRKTAIEWKTGLGPDLAHVRYRQGHDIDTTQFSGSAAWTHPFEAAGSLLSKTNVAWNREDYHFSEQGFAIDDRQNLDDDTRALMDVVNLGTSGKWSLPESGRHRFELGWEASVDRRRETRIQHLRPVGESPEMLSDLSFDAQIRRLALYAQDDVRLSGFWSVYLGLRGEVIQTVSEGDTVAGLRNRASVLSPVLQSLWKLPDSDRNQVRLALSRSYKSPSLTSLSARPYTSTNNRALDPDMRGNPDLRPELATGLDLAWEHDGQDGQRISLGGYLRRIEDVVRTEVQRIDGRWVAFPDNRGTASARGLELDARIRPARIPGLDLSANASRNWSTVDQVPGPNNRLDEQLRFSASVAADWKASDDWSFGASFRYRNGGPVRVSLYRGTVAAWRRELDVYALWSLSPRCKLRLSAGDLLHQDQINGQWYQDADGVQQVERLRTPPPTLRAQLEVQL
jgi:outer membrane receptor for ferrienterochelin and colicins